MLSLFQKQNDIKTLQKVPRRILVLAPKVLFQPNIQSDIDFEPKDKDYDLLVYVDKAFRLNLKFPFSIANSEIWFERGEVLTEQIFLRALRHYSNCEIRNGA